MSDAAPGATGLGVARPSFHLSPDCHERFPVSSWIGLVMSDEALKKLTDISAATGAALRLDTTATCGSLKQGVQLVLKELQTAAGFLMVPSGSDDRPALETVDCILQNVSWRLEFLRTEMGFTTSADARPRKFVPA